MRDVKARGLEGPGLSTRIDVGPHHLRADEPVEKGGTDTGPSPHNLLLAALGACTSMTLRLYAQRKGWPLAEVEVRLDGATENGRYVIERHIRLDGPLDVEQRARLIEIADRCPVHRTLVGEIVISTTEALEV